MLLFIGMLTSLAYYAPLHIISNVARLCSSPKLQTFVTPFCWSSDDVEILAYKRFPTQLFVFESLSMDEETSEAFRRRVHHSIKRFLFVGD